MRVLSCLVIGLMLSASGCTRRVVIDPDRVAQQNDSDWKIKKTPVR